MKRDKETDKATDRQTKRQTKRQTDKETDRQTDGNRDQQGIRSCLRNVRTTYWCISGTDLLIQVYVLPH